jgi:hypothetical protein
MAMAISACALLGQLQGPAQKEMVRTIFSDKHLYTEEELCDFVSVLPYPESFWYILKNDIGSYIEHTHLWTDSETECFHNLRGILLKDVTKFKDAIYRFVQQVYPETMQIPDLTYLNAFDILRKAPTEVHAYIESIMPRTKGYIKMKKKRVLRYDGRTKDSFRRYEVGGDSFAESLPPLCRAICLVAYV